MTTSPDSPSASGIVTHKLVISREFKAPRELVWQAWTQPEHVKEWLSLGEDITIGSVKADLHTGGRFRIQQQMDDGEFYTAAGVYLEVKAPEKLVYTWDWEKDGAGEEYGELEGNPTQVTLQLYPSENNDQHTRLVLTHEKFATEKSRDSHQVGWTSWLGRLAQFVEKA